MHFSIWIFHFLFSQISLQLLFGAKVLLFLWRKLKLQKSSSAWAWAFGNLIFYSNAKAKSHIMHLQIGTNRVEKKKQGYMYPCSCLFSEGGPSYCGFSCLFRRDYGRHTSALSGTSRTTPGLPSRACCQPAASVSIFRSHVGSNWPAPAPAPSSGSLYSYIS